ncbi:MAG: hypothetical protein WAU70_10220 [Flavobacteriales bacterium]
MADIPDLFVPQNLSFRFTHLECETTGEIGPAEPYLWIFFYKIDAEGFRFSEAGTGLLGSPVTKLHQGSAIAAQPGREDWRSMMAGTMVDIPVHIGEWKQPVVPIRAPSQFQNIFRGGDIQVPGLFGFVVALLEQDSSRTEARVQAHARLNELIPKFLKDYIEGTPLNHLMEGMPPEEMAALTGDMEVELFKIYFNHMTPLGLLDPDDALGVVSRTYVVGPLPPVIVLPGEKPPKQKHLVLDGQSRQPRFLSFGVPGAEDDTEEKRAERARNGKWHIGAEYDVHRTVEYVPLGDAVSVKVFAGANGDLASLTLNTLGRPGSRGTVETWMGPRTFVTYRFDADELGELNNAIGSIEIPTGYKVVLYEKPGFQGRSLTIDRYSVVGARFSLHRFVMPPPLDERLRIGAPPEMWNNRISAIEIVIEDVSALIH